MNIEQFNTDRFNVIVTVPSGNKYAIGQVARKEYRGEFGWIFFPRMPHRHPSRKLHATKEKAIPRYVGPYELQAPA